MADKLRKFRKDSYVEKRFGKDINVSTKEDAPLKKDMSAAETKSVAKAKPASSGAAPSSFSAAFAAARKAAIDAGRDPDKEIFTWGGQKKVAKLATSGNKATSTPARRAAPAATTTRTNATTPAQKSVVKPSLTTAFDRAGPKPTAKPKETPKSGAQQRGDYASRLTQSAAAKRKLESAPTETPGSSFARLKNAFGFGSSADARLATTMRRSAANQAQNEARMNKVKAERAAAESERIRIGKEKAKAGNPMYQSYLNKAKGGKIDGIAVRGRTKAGRKK